MGLREFWNRLTSRDSPEREKEELENLSKEELQRIEDVEGMKDDIRIGQHYPGTERLPDDHL
jgi:hypothetical protein